MSSLVRRVRERFDVTAQAIRRTRERMRGATTYQEWRELATQLDALDANRLGGRCSFEESKLYDRKLLLQKLSHLQQVREGGNIREIMFNLRSDLIRNVANIAKRCGPQQRGGAGEGASLQRGARSRGWRRARGGAADLGCAVYRIGRPARGAAADAHCLPPFRPLHPPAASCTSTATRCRQPSAATSRRCRRR